MIVRYSNKKHLTGGLSPPAPPPLTLSSCHDTRSRGASTALSSGLAVEIFRCGPQVGLLHVSEHYTSTEPQHVCSSRSQLSTYSPTPVPSICSCLVTTKVGKPITKGFCRFSRYFLNRQVNIGHIANLEGTARAHQGPRIDQFGNIQKET